MVRRELPAEIGPVFPCDLRTDLPVGRLQQDGQVRIGRPHFLYHILSGEVPSVGGLEREVRDDTQDVLSEAVEQADGLVVAACQQDLGSSAHPEPGPPLVQGLLDAGPVLLDQERVHVRQVGRYELHRVLDEDYHLDIGRVGIVLDVDAVLYELDHGEEHRRVSQPVEHVVDVRAVLALEDLGLAVVRRRRQRYERQRAVELLDLLCKALNAVASQIQHGYDEVEFEGLQQFQGLFLAAGMGDLGGIGKSQGRVLPVQFLLNPSVFLQHEPVVFRADQKHVVDVLEHE